MLQNMDKYIDRFPQQLLEAVEIGLKVESFSFEREIKHIVVSGMGGSGIGGLLLKDALKHKLAIPFEVSNDYQLPASCNQHTLVICSSYSGNTEETISSLQDALRKGCMIACVTTGGKLHELAKSNNLPVILIPGGMPPRTCLGYSSVAQLFILKHSGLIDEQFIADIKSTAAMLSAQKNEIQLTAKIIADRFQNTIPLIYADISIYAVALRWKQQINENAKMACFANVLPEMNHNELVAFHEADQRIGVIYLRHNHEHPQTAKRFELTSELIQEKICCSTNVAATSASALENMFYLIHVGDWVSLYLSQLKGVDPIKIDMLDWLKTALEKK